ncbi:methyltransferase-like protein [Beauveria bassiana ARSEF 2860]|uniref:Methyltransferase-like protein n=1 Tax=Beauveria bassiana (strain ARSEF 2860) TaxID=655819 RepID=J5JLC2_BEAB2|nr:methyltransferase-like protein [Beauveria bassiana ARSEF 2860]EJP63966.1 methyltransferase-like protein [Beauveria bassiana ARSEF 2860]
MTDSNFTEALYNEIAESYEEAYTDDPGITQAFERLKESHAPGSSILDVGCGPGGPASRLIAAGYNVTGIDVAQGMIDICQKLPSGTFLKVDMMKYETEAHFDGILSLFSLFQVSYAATYSMIFKMASWLRPGGTLVLAVIAGEDYIQDVSQLSKLRQNQHVENADTSFMGRLVPSTLLTAKEWLRIVQEAGFVVQSVDRHDFEVAGFDSTEKHLFITAKRTHLEPLFGPFPLPAVKRGPCVLSESAWRAFAERLTRHDLDYVLEAVKGNKEVLDVGSGHGELPLSIAKKVGKAYAVEPNSDRNGLLVKNCSEAPVQVYKGTAENLPFEDNKFDAAVAVFILDYVDDLERSLREMARVVDPAAPNARIVIVQGTPDNEAINFINRACAHIAEESMAQGESAVSHQGLLLATAARVFTQHGFGDIQVRRVPTDCVCSFPEADLSTRCKVAANILTDIWYKDHQRVEDMRAAFEPILEEHFSSCPWKVGDQAVLLMAKPTVEPSAVRMKV